MARRRVAITGLGVATAAGVGADAFWNALLGGESFVRPVTSIDLSGFPTVLGGELQGFSAKDYVPKHYRKAVKVMARDIELAVAAADLAFRDSGIVTRGIDPDAATIAPKRLGCNIGAGLICSDLDELGAAVNTALTDGHFDLRRWGNEGMTNLTPLWLLKYLPNMLACHVTIIHGAEGPSNTITCGDASGHLAIGEATRLIQRDAADAVIAGGAESKLNPMGLLRQSLLNRLVSTRTAGETGTVRPFDAAHCGTVVGEGGGLLILEDLERARERGARIYAEVVGFGAACDPEAVDVTRPTVGNVGLAVTKALADAQIAPQQVGAILAHGTGVPAEDDIECDAWHTAMGDRAADIPCCALTGAHGSLFAGAGGASLAAAALMLHHQTVPPTANFSNPSAACRLALSSAPRSLSLPYVVSGAFTVGGQSGACVLKRYEA